MAWLLTQPRAADGIFPGEQARERLSGLSSGFCEFVSDIASLRIQPDEELTGQCGPDELLGRPSTRGRVAGHAQLLVAVPEVGVVFSYHFGDDEEDGAHPLAPATYRGLPVCLPLSRAIGARPVSLAIALLERVPISGISAMRRAMVRSATPLIDRKAWLRATQTGSV
jgi:hypothetical protein